MRKRLWDKGESLNKRVLAFTVGKDPELDQEILRWDILASVAHARALASIGILSQAESDSLIAVLKEALTLADSGKFVISTELEDCHTALEAFLVERLGEVGKKIHTGRSRNDQVLVAVRLFTKDATIKVLELLSGLIEALGERIEKEGDVPLPGYTHMQAAMPCSVGMWLGGFYEWGLELLRSGLSLLDRIDSNPLGAASGFGVPLRLNRTMTTALLGFKRVQRNPVNIQNSRGREELAFLEWTCESAQLIEKLSSDLIIFSMSEFAYFTLPQEFTTGSSIMPQKRNPDVLELLRSSAAKVRASAQELLLVIAKLPSNYHRDFQHTKEPLLRGTHVIVEMLSVCIEVVRTFQVQREVLEASMSSDLFATYAVYREVQGGMNFREAYEKTAKSLGSKTFNAKDFSKEFSLVQEMTKEDQKLGLAEFKQVSNNISSQKLSFLKSQENLFRL